MATLLQTQQALDAAKATFKRAPSATTSAAVERAFDEVALAQIMSGMPEKAGETLQAKVIHREKYEKTTTEVPEKSEKAAASEPESAPETVDSAAESESEESKKMPFKGKGKDKSKRAEEGDEDEEAKALAAFDSADRAYKSKAVGVDAYATRGPSALLKACFKAFGVSTIGEAFGALAGVPEKQAAHKDLAARLAKLEARRSTDDLEALISRAKIEGRTRGVDDRKELRAFANEFGLKALERRINDREPKRTMSTGYHAEADNKTGNAGVIPGVSEDDIKESIVRATAGMSADEKKIYEEEFRAGLAKTRLSAVAV